MKNYFTLIFILAFALAKAQSNYQDVIYLKNGSVIHGMIIEQVPNQSIKIQTLDENIFVYKIDEIEKITKEEKQKHETAQKDWSATTYFSFAINSAAPYGTFKDKYSNGGENALPGFSTSLSAHFELIPNFGLAAKYIYQRNAPDKNGYADPSAYYSPTKFTFDGAWSFNNFLGGIQLFLRLSSQSSIDIYALGGISTGNAPNVTISYSSPNSSILTISRKYDSFSSAQVLFGLDYRIKFTNYLGFFANAEFSLAQPKITSHFTDYSYYNYPSIVSVYSQTRYINTLNLGIGISYILK